MIKVLSVHFSESVEGDGAEHNICYGQHNQQSGQRQRVPTPGSPCHLQCGGCQGAPKGTLGGGHLTRNLTAFAIRGKGNAPLRGKGVATSSDEHSCTRSGSRWVLCCPGGAKGAGGQTLYADRSPCTPGTAPDLQRVSSTESIALQCSNVLSELLDDVILDVAFECHREAHYPVVTTPYWSIV